jgi:hypothetical protein
MTYLPEMFQTEKINRSGFKTSDQVQGQGTGRSRKRSIHGYVSIYRRLATQPLSFRWGFEITYKPSTNRQHRSSNDKRKRLAVLAKPRRCRPGAVNVFYKAWD